MDVQRQGDQVCLYLASEEGELTPRRRLYWLFASPQPGGWRAWFPADRFENWRSQAVSTEPPETGKGAWRLATRFAMVRFRQQPEALGVSAPLLGDATFERMEG